MAALDQRNVGFVLIPEANVRSWVGEHRGFEMEDGAAVLATILVHWLAPTGGHGQQITPEVATELLARSTVRRVQSAAQIVPELPADHRGPGYLVEFAEPMVPGGKVGMGPDCIALLNDRNAGWVMMQESVVRDFMDECKERNRNKAAFLAAATLGPILCHGAPLAYPETVSLTDRCSQIAWHPSGRAVMQGLPPEWTVPVCVVRFRG